MYRNTNVKEIAEYINLDYEGKNIEINGVSPFNGIVNNTVSFTLNKEINQNKIALVIVTLDAVIQSNNLTIIRSKNPRYIFAKVTQFLRKYQSKQIHKLALVDRAAELDPDVSIGPFSIIEAGVKVLKGTVIEGRVTVKEGVEIGSECILKTGAVIGEDGFGFGFDNEKTALKINHSGSVIIGNQVEIGTNTVICSGTICPTKICDFVKIDDLVFIAHNCQIGEKTIIVAGAVVSGSVIIGRRCWIGPNASIINGVSIADEVTIGIGAIITKSITSSSKYMGLNSLPLRQLAALKRRIRFSEQ
jgi:UDP-3-O-[3-hydroxymyristoyl] glucosamine N-acyltransferase LpxD